MVYGVHAYVHGLNGHIYNFKVDLMGNLLTIQPPYKIALIRKSNSIVQQDRLSFKLQQPV